MPSREILKAIDSALGVGVNIVSKKKDLEAPRTMLVKEMFNNRSDIFKQVYQAIEMLKNGAQKSLERRDKDYKIEDFANESTRWRNIFSEKNVQKIMSISRMVGKALIFREGTINSISDQMTYLSVQQRTLMRAVLSTYFKHGDEMSLIFYNMNLVAKRGDGLFRGAISGVGPILMKMFQQVGNAPTGSSDPVNQKRLEDLAEMMDDVFSNTPSMSEVEKEVVWTNLAKDTNIKPYLNNVDRNKPLGSASLAEAYKVTKDGKEFVLKFIRPIYMVYFLAEAERLLGDTWSSIEKFARIEMMRDNGGEEPDEETLGRIVYQTQGLILFTIKEVAKEFDYVQEVKNTIQGYKIYNLPKKGIRSVEIIQCPATPETTVPCMIQNYASGSVPLDKFLKGLAKDKKMKSKKKHKIYQRIYNLVYSLSEEWNRQLIFESGFGHFDLHAGNILLTNAQNKDAKPEDIGFFLIDFGSAGFITKRDQYFLLRAAITASRMTTLRHLLEKRDGDEEEDKEDPRLTKEQRALSQEIVRYFRKSGITEAEKRRVTRRVAEDPQKYRKIHERNLLLLCNFEEYVWKLCQNRKDEIPPDVVLETLDYSWDVKMSILFLRLAGRATSMANCMSSNVLWMGKGGAYLQSLGDKIFAKCPKGTCEEFIVDSYLASQLWPAAKLLILGYVQYDRSVLSSPRCKKVTSRTLYAPS